MEDIQQSELITYVIQGIDEENNPTYSTVEILNQPNEGQLPQSIQLQQGNRLVIKQPTQTSQDLIVSQPSQLFQQTNLMNHRLQQSGQQIIIRKPPEKQLPSSRQLVISQPREQLLQGNRQLVIQQPVSLSKSAQQLKQSNLQLQIRNQQLQIPMQQLLDSNQQLQDSNQQLQDSNQQIITDQFDEMKYVKQEEGDQSGFTYQVFTTDSFNVLQLNSVPEMNQSSFFESDSELYSDVLQASEAASQFADTCCNDDETSASLQQTLQQQAQLQQQSDCRDQLDTEVTSSSRVDIKTMLNSTAERINQYLTQMEEMKQTRERLNAMLRETEAFATSLRNQLRAEVEKGANLKEEIKTVISENEKITTEDQKIDSGEVEKFLREIERGESAIAECFEENCLFVECIAADPLPDLTEDAKDDVSLTQVKSEISTGVTGKRKRTAKRHFDDVVYNPRTYDRSKRKAISSKGKSKDSSGINRQCTEEEDATTPVDDEITNKTTGSDSTEAVVNIHKIVGESVLDGADNVLESAATANGSQCSTDGAGSGSGKDSKASKTYQCSMCSLTFTRLTDRTQHETNEHQPTDEKVSKEPWRRKRSFHCPRCSQVFKWFKDMQKHVREEHYAKDPNECDICGKRFVTRFVLKNHRKLHEAVRPYQCTMCQKTYKTNGELKAHVRTHTGEKVFKCSECEESFSSYVQRKIHMRSHTGERPPYMCSICHYEFHLRSSLIKHMRIHTGEKPYLCSHCGKSFTESSGYRVHLRLHSGIRPYVCPECGKSYVQSERLKTHMRTHTGEKRYACDVCGMRYMYSRGLRDHMEKHTGEPRYACHECNRKFVNALTLGKHMRKHVKKEVTLEYFVVDGIF